MANELNISPEVLAKLKGQAMSSPSVPMQIDSIDEDKINKVSEGAAKIVSDPSVKEAAKNIVKNNKKDLEAATGKQFTKKAQDAVIKKLDKPEEMANIANNTQQGKEQKGATNKWMEALAYFTPELLGAAIGGIGGAILGIEPGEGIVAGVEGAQQMVEPLKEKEAQAAAAAAKQEQFNQTLDVEKTKADTAEKSRKDDYEIAQANLKLKEEQMLKQNDLAALAEKYKNITGKQKNAEEMQKLAVPGVGIALSDKDAGFLKDYTANYKKVKGLIQNIKDISDGITKVDREDIAKVQSNLAQLVGALRIDIVGPGAFTDSEREFVKGIIGDPTLLFGAESIERAKLDQLMQNKENDFTNQKSLRTVEGLQDANEKQAILAEMKRRGLR